MKHLSYAIAFTLALATAAPSGQAIEAKATHLHSSVALPRNARVPSATYRLRIHVENIPLIQISISRPEPLNVKRDISVVNQAGEIVSATLTVNGNMLTIAFAQPITPGTILQVDLNGVSTSDYLGRTWLLPVSSRSAGMNTDILLGLARIQTSK